MIKARGNHVSMCGFYNIYEKSLAGNKANWLSMNAKIPGASIINTREEGVKPLVSAYDSGQVISELIIYQLKTL